MILFLILLAVLFIGLKLAAIGTVAAWSWYLVLSPIWVPVGAVILFFIGVGLLALLATLLK